MIYNIQKIRGGSAMDRIQLRSFEKKVLLWIATSQMFGSPVPEKGMSWVTVEGNFGMTISAPTYERSLKSLGLVRLDKGFWVLTKKGREVVAELSLKLLNDNFASFL